MILLRFVHTSQKIHKFTDISAVLATFISDTITITNYHGNSTICI